MALFHVNPATGVPGRCSAASGACPFGETAAHAFSMAGARKLWESSQNEATVQPALKKMPGIVSGITDSDRSTFSRGDCYTLAYAIHQRYGLPIVRVGEQRSDGVWSHMLNQLPNGDYLDIDGVHSEGEVWERWVENEKLEEDAATPIKLRRLSSKEVDGYPKLVASKSDSAKSEYQPANFMRSYATVFSRVLPELEKLMSL